MTNLNLYEFREAHKDHFTKDNLWFIKNKDKTRVGQLMLGNTVGDLFVKEPFTHDAEYLGLANLASTQEKAKELVAKVDAIISDIKAGPQIINDIPEPVKETKKETKKDEK